MNNYLKLCANKRGCWEITPNQINEIKSTFTPADRKNEDKKKR